MCVLVDLKSVSMALIARNIHVRGGPSRPHLSARNDGRGSQTRPQDEIPRFYPYSVSARVPPENRSADSARRSHPPDSARIRSGHRRSGSNSHFCNQSFRLGKGAHRGIVEVHPTSCCPRLGEGAPLGDSSFGGEPLPAHHPSPPPPPPRPPCGAI